MGISVLVWRQRFWFSEGKNEVVGVAVFKKTKH